MDELLARVAADPDADEPRQVLADWWMERGDPRGEFVALQLERARRFPHTGWRPISRLPSREHELLDGPAWFGSAFMGLGRVWVDRGFPRGARIRHRDGIARQLRGEPGLCTVRTLVLDSPATGSPPDWSELVKTPGLANVRRLVQLPADTLPTLDAAPMQPTQVILLWRTDLAAGPVRVPSSVRELVVPVGAPADLQRLASIDVPTLGIWSWIHHEQRPAPQEFLAAAHPSVRRVHLIGGVSMALVFDRTPTGWQARLQPAPDADYRPLPLDLDMLGRWTGNVDPTVTPDTRYGLRPNGDSLATLAQLPPAPVLLVRGTWRPEQQLAELVAPSVELPDELSNTRRSAVWLAALESNEGVPEFRIEHPSGALVLRRSLDGRFRHAEVSGRFGFAIEHNWLPLVARQLLDVTYTPHLWIDEDAEKVEGWCAAHGVAFRNAARAVERDS
ncbi:MAG: TIGR02996 domain-containing protein [Myxococcales bacterium]|nr:TIGR02996 domain-containing protein [Myxococcales bacterium]